MSKNGDCPAIEARGLVKVYGRTRAVDGIDLTVRRGQVFGFLGPNGAGKTTTIRTLATLTAPDGGNARVLGYDVVSERNAIRARVSVTGQFASLDNDLTAYENLMILGRLRGLSRAARALEGTVNLAADPLALSMLLATPDGTTDVGRLVGQAMTQLAEAGVGVAEVTLGQPSMDEAFLALTGHAAGPVTDHEDVNA